jgi:hypothetical protein
MLTTPEVIVAIPIAGLFVWWVHLIIKDISATVRHGRR